MEIEVKNIDHLGIIAGLIDEIGIVEIIDREIGIDKREKVSAGEAIKAMIINCMGFVTSPFYLFSGFFTGKATEHLIGKGIKAEYLNESRLGRVLEQVYEYGVTILYIKIAYEMMKRFGIKVSSGHIDGTSLSVEGKYLQSEQGEKKDSEEESEPAAINITYGYSRDQRPDLKQFTLSLLTIGEEGIPLYLKVGDGNAQDKKIFPKLIKEFKAQWQGEQPKLYVMDAAFYSEENIQDFGESISWISRVPLSINAAQELTKTLLPEQFSPCPLNPNYQFCSVCSEYGSIKQRWIVVESQQRRTADLETFAKQIKQSLDVKLKALKSLQKKGFACEADARMTASDFEKTLPYHLFAQLDIIVKPHYQRQGRPAPDDTITHYTYHLQATLKENDDALNLRRNQAGRFILATTELNESLWTPSLLLQEYKAQQSTERGFRFLKDPLFFASRVFLKSTKRIMALAMVMTLALMVYSLGQHQLRQALLLADATLPNQKGKPTTRPTLRWILQCFQAVHLVFIDGLPSYIKLNPRQSLILQFLGSASHKYYFLS
jgi:transposase